MIHVIASIELRAGTRAHFLREFTRLVPDVRAEDGCLEYRGAVDVAAGVQGQLPARADVVTVIERWQSVAALELHLVAPHMVAYRERVRDYVTGVALQILAPAGEPA